jgi:thiol-disulfide isomerase/thioredoxin
LKISNSIFNRISIFLIGIAALQAVAQTADPNPDVPKSGALAPPLTFDHVLQAPDGSKQDWASLRGKVVVLEFWATWCVPCVAEIPIWNSLAASVDPAKVQFISVDDEPPSVVEPFLKRKPISGWIGLDTTSKVFQQYGVDARPKTMVIDPNGHVVSTSVHPETLKKEQLLALAEGLPVQLGGPADAKVQASLDAAVSAGFKEQAARSAGGEKSVFEISLTPVETPTDGTKLDTHVMELGPGHLDIANADSETLLQFGAGIPASRISVNGKISENLYNLHVEAPSADPKQLVAAIELAIGSGTGIHIEHRTAETDAYVLKLKAAPPEQPTNPAHGGFAYYNAKGQTLHCIHATAEQIASALEKAVGKPVVNESEWAGHLSGDVKIVSQDLAAVNTVLEQASGLTLVSARRPIETVVISAELKPVEQGPTIIPGKN